MSREAKARFLGLSWETLPHTSSGKFLRVESCYPESFDFLHLWDRRTQYIVLLEFAGIPFLLKSDSFPTNDQAVFAVDQCESRYGASIFMETSDVGLNNNDQAS